MRLDECARIVSTWRPVKVTLEQYQAIMPSATEHDLRNITWADAMRALSRPLSFRFRHLERGVDLCFVDAAIALGPAKASELLKRAGDGDAAEVIERYCDLRTGWNADEAFRVGRLQARALMEIGEDARFVLWNADKCRVKAEILIFVAIVLAFSCAIMLILTPWAAALLPVTMLLAMKSRVLSAMVSGMRKELISEARKELFDAQERN